MSFRNLFGSQVHEQTAQRLPLAAFGLRQNDEASIKERTERARRDQEKQREDAAQAEADALAADLAAKEAEREEQLQLTAETNERLAAAHAHKLKRRFAHILQLHRLQTASDNAIARHLERPDDQSLLLIAQETSSTLWEFKYSYIKRTIMSNTASPISS